MDMWTLIMLAVAIAALGVFYRRYRARDLPYISDSEFLHDFARRHSVPVSSETILIERRRVARILGVPPEKLASSQTLKFLSKRFGYFAEFSVAWSDLLDEAREARSAANLRQREQTPTTVGELIEDLLQGPQ